MYVRPGRLAQGVFLSALDNLYIQEESVMEKKYDFQKAEKALEKMWQENEIYRYQNGKERKIFSIDTMYFIHLVLMIMDCRQSA